MPLWRGKFTYKITELTITEDPGGGEAPLVSRRFWNTFTRNYRYRSPTADGQFGLPSGPGTGPLIRFGLYIPLPLGYGTTDYSFTNSEVPGPLITIAGGSVTDFELNNEIGPVGLSFDLTTFHIVRNAGDGYSYSARGWINIEDPVRTLRRMTGKAKKIKEVVN